MAPPVQRANGNGAGDENELDSDECPICHSTRYLRRDMRFLVNPECYHKMCESCVDRIFSHGPAQCPVAGCRKVLRRNKFRAPTFGDLKMEREVDIRKRMARIFNRREDDFESLLDYNNYLNKVEDLTFNLINEIDVEKTNEEIKGYEDKHHESIIENRRLEAQEIEEQKIRQAYEEERSRQLRAAALKEEEEDRLAMDQLRRNVISRLATGSGNAKRIAREGEAALRKAGRKREILANDRAGPGANSLSFQGLRKRGAKPEPEKPYDPFGGMSNAKDHVILPDMVPDMWDDFLGPARKDSKYIAGGYSVNGFITRALCDLYGGLDFTIGEDNRETTSTLSPTSREVAMVDVFS